MADIRDQLLQGDRLALEGRYAEAVGVYLSAALHYSDAGFALRAVAVLRKVVVLIDQHAANLSVARRQALTHLHALHSELGQAEDAARTLELLGDSAV